MGACDVEGATMQEGDAAVKKRKRPSNPNESCGVEKPTRDGSHGERIRVMEFLIPVSLVRHAYLQNETYTVAASLSYVPCSQDENGKIAWTWSESGTWRKARGPGKSLSISKSNQTAATSRTVDKVVTGRAGEQTAAGGANDEIAAVAQGGDTEDAATEGAVDKAVAEGDWDMTDDYLPDHIEAELQALESRQQSSKPSGEGTLPKQHGS